MQQNSIYTKLIKKIKSRKEYHNGKEKYVMYSTNPEYRLVRTNPSHFPAKLRSNSDCSLSLRQRGNICWWLKMC